MYVRLWFNRNKGKFEEIGWVEYFNFGMFLDFRRMRLYINRDIYNGFILYNLELLPFNIVWFHFTEESDGVMLKARDTDD
ncbi:hypothetical protein EBR96_07490 [bacterium]|nr:hypothetical protein [bacterium]